MPDRRPFDTVAAVDLGSNSFHMVVARVEGDDFQIVDRLKSPVRLAAGLDKAGTLSAAAQEAALEALTQFGQRCRDLPRGAVRAVGTNTLRKAHNALPFLIRAARALGHPIEVIAGREEARLIYQGVYRDVHTPGRRLVIDIGGGSTELILGDGPTPLLLDSLHMGCVSWSDRFFAGGEVSREALRRAVTAAHLELETVFQRYRDALWETALGSSGTVNAVAKIQRELGFNAEGITPAGLKRIRAKLLQARRVARLELPGLTRDRRAVLPGGVAILTALFQALNLSTLVAVEGALREGVLVDLLGRMHQHDVREPTVARVAERYQVDPAQAARVEATALALFDQVAPSLGLDPDRDRDLLRWAARLHEVGMFVAWSGYHKHGAYVLSQADLPGFSRSDQQSLAALVLSHRGRLAFERIAEQLPNPGPEVLGLIVLLRLAVRLHRSRSPQPLPAIRALAGPGWIGLGFPDGWLDAHPLTRADLVVEGEDLAGVGLVLRAS